MKPVLRSAWFLGASLLAIVILAQPLRAQPRIRIDNLSVTEGAAGTSQQAALNLTLTAASDALVTVALGSSPGSPAAAVGSACGGAADFLQPSGTVRFEPGVVSQRIEVTVCGDAADEADEIFRVDLLDPVGATLADLRGRITIVDDDGAVPLPTIAIGNATPVFEGDGPGAGATANFNILLSFIPAHDVFVNFEIDPAETGCATSDYVTEGGRVLTLTGSKPARGLGITICGDTVVEPDETFRVRLSNPIGATIAVSEGVGTILNDDGVPLPRVSIGDATVVERTGETSGTFVLTLSSPAVQEVEVDWVLASTTATVRGCCVCGSPSADARIAVEEPTARFGPGDSRAEVEFVVCADSLDEPLETFQVLLSNPVRATLRDSVGVGTIRDNDAPPALSITPVVRIAEPPAGQIPAVFLVTLGGQTAQRVTVDFATEAGTARAGSGCLTNFPDFTDYLSQRGRLTFNSGTTTRRIEVPVCVDPINDEPTQTFTVTLSDPVNATILAAEGTARISD